MGLTVYVYRNSLGDCTNHGISEHAKSLCLVNVPGPFEPKEDYPAAMLVAWQPFGPSRPMVKIVPAVQVAGKWEPKPGWSMFGGNYAATSDGRFHDACQELTGQEYYGAVAIHDRFE